MGTALANSTHAQRPAWLRLAVCPDCRGRLDLEAEPLRCATCRREIPRLNTAYNFLPAGMSARSNTVAPMGGTLRQRFVRTVYTRHNHSRAVRRALRRMFDELGAEDWGLNLGSADTSLHSRLINLDLDPSPTVDALGTAERLPFADGALACVVSQEVFEHLPDPWAAAREVHRVLRPGGLFYVQTPFVMGFHSGPHDYWRFTDQGLRTLLEQCAFEVREVGSAVGAGTAAYRIAVEFAAATVSAVWSRLYYPAKAAAAVVFAPLRWTDCFTSRRSATNRVCAGFYAIARK
jgi:SAM-dependent methyltransferase